MPYYVIRLAGGILYLSGVFVMAWNVWMTVRGARAVNPAIPLENDNRATAPAGVPAAVPAV